jgi:alkaline phosphatase
LNKKIFLPLIAALFFNAAICYTQTNKPKNIILLIGDGMGLNAVTSSELYLDNSQFRRFTHTGLVVTTSADTIITDSGAGATALATGERTKNQSISVDVNGKILPTVLEFAKSKGLSTALIATKSITDATPAAFYSHVSERTHQSEIAEMLMQNKVDIIIGGGAKYFLPKNMKGSRKDEKNIIDSLIERGYKYTVTFDELKQTAPKDKVVSLLDNGNLPKANERNYSLGELTELTLKKLKLNKKGFFVMVEGSQIDTWEHTNNFDYTMAELKDFNSAVKIALDFAQKEGNTLVIVVADHETGGLSITGGDFKKPVPSWTTKDHTASMVGVFTFGPGSGLFTGIIDNFQIGRNIFKNLGKK